MRYFNKILLNFVVWTTLGLILTARLYFQKYSSWNQEQFLETLLIGLPSWGLWLVTTPAIFLIVSKIPLKKDVIAKSISLQFGLSLLYPFTHIFLFTLVGNLLAGTEIVVHMVLQKFRDNLSIHYFFVFSICLAVMIVANLYYLYKRKHPNKEEDEYSTSLLITTGVGKVLMEIVKVERVPGAGRRIMFHTDRSRYLIRKEVLQKEKRLVAQRHYRPDRAIVIDLAKVREIKKVSADHYEVKIGKDHLLKLDEKFYRKLKFSLPQVKE